MRWSWIAAALISGIVVFVVTNVNQGTCYDSATSADASHCESGPMLGVYGVWVLWIAWGLFAAYAVWRAMRRHPTGTARR